MNSKRLHDAIRIVAETANFDPLFDYFADDVELRVSVALQSQASEERRGRQSVIRHLQRLYSADSPTSEEPVDLSSSGQRIVACRTASFAIGGGLTVRDDCALVFDISGGLIKHLAINHELSTSLDAGASVPPLGRAHEVRRIDGSVAQTAQS